MSDNSSYVGKTVRFKPGPRSTKLVDAKVTGVDGAFLVTKDATGYERRVRPGATTIV